MVKFSSDEVRSKLRNKAIVIIVLVLASSVLFLAPSLLRTAEIGGGPAPQGPDTWFIYMTGTTPHARALVDGIKIGSMTYNTGQIVNGTAGQDAGAFLNAITAPSLTYSFSGQNFTEQSQWTLQSGDVVQGLYNQTMFIAGANNFDMVGIVHPSAGTPAASSIQMSRLSFFANGHLGVDGLNFNRSISETATADDVGYLQFFGTFNYLAILDGNEASSLHDVFIGSSLANGYGDISFKVAGGASLIDNVQYMGAGGQSSVVHLMAQQFTVSRSTLNGIVVEEQSFAFLGSRTVTHQQTFGELDLKDNFFANNDPGGLSRIVSKQNGPIIFTLKFSGNYVDIANGGALLSSVGSGAIINVSYGYFDGNTFVNPVTNTTGYWFKNQGGAGGILFNDHWTNNYVGSGIVKGPDIMTTGLCSSFALVPEPAGFTPQYNPTLPVGIGPGNAVQACATPWPITGYMNITKANGTQLVTGAHIIDYTTGTDTFIGNPTTITLYSGDKVYFANTVPYSWTWYGDEW